jgi:hypothetical protein
MGRKRREITYDINEKGCHICTSHKPTEDGYIRLDLEGKKQYYHRYLYEQTYGKLPNKMEVRHKCDNPYCINIDHLEYGTHQDNMNDRSERNRCAKLQGEDNHFSILSEKDVIEIRKNNIISYSKLAKIYGVSKSAIAKIKTFKTWTHLKEE